ncbi:MAG: hypothetical protein GXY83_22720 [Rhodopirellula sp.]|nr:hypothetical protein [Rhodopirellula sp.]
MKHVMLVLFAVVALAGLTGCANHGMVNGACAGGPGGCPSGFGGACGPGACGACAGGLAANCGQHTCGINLATPVAPPPFGAVSYPYYTVRGPRDFLSPAPRPIGP